MKGLIGVPLPADAVIAAAVDAALAEDIGSGDVSAALVDADARAEAVLVTREAAVLCGRAWADLAFRRLDPAIRIEWARADGEACAADEVLCRISGNARAILSAERTALNFVQLLSATATTTARYVAALAGSRTRVLDTRKTIPGLRLAQKYAVRCGGGSNHRLGLYDAFLVKENHIAAAGSIAAAVARARALAPALPVEVEVENLGELDEALAAGVERVMLDEFTDADLVTAVARARGRCEIEVSGGVGLERLAALAALGVDYVSVGALTKHVRAVDLSLRVSARAGQSQS